MKDFLRKNWHWLVLGLTAICVMTIVFSLNGFFDTRIDAPIYAAQITSFAQGTPFVGDATVMLRLFKPLYAIIGGTIFHSAHPYGMILSLNIIFYILLIGTAYLIFKELNFSKAESTVGALWIATGYPLLKYGLALGTDMSGWFLSALTVLVALVALRKNSSFLLCLASIVGFLGALAKESGVLGLIAVCLMVAWRFRTKGIKVWVAKILSIGLPALILYGVLLAVIAGHAPTFLDWFGANKTEYSGTHTYSLIKLIAVEGSTFGLYWLGVIYAIISMIRSRRVIEHVDLIIAAFISTLVVLLWPLFISRILFIQFLWVIPLALYGYKLLLERSSLVSSARQRLMSASMIAMPIIVNVILFLLSSGGSLFDSLRI